MCEWVCKGFFHPTLTAMELYNKRTSQHSNLSFPMTPLKNISDHVYFPQQSLRYYGAWLGGGWLVGGWMVVDGWLGGGSLVN